MFKVNLYAYNHLAILINSFWARAYSVLIFFSLIKTLVSSPYIIKFEFSRQFSNLIMYADDTNVFIKEKNINTLYARAQNELK